MSTEAFAGWADSSVLVVEVLLSLSWDMEKDLALREGDALSAGWVAQGVLGTVGGAGVRLGNAGYM